MWGPQLSHGTVEATSFSSQRPQLCLGEPDRTGNLQSLLLHLGLCYHLLSFKMNIRRQKRSFLLLHDSPSHREQGAHTRRNKTRFHLCPKRPRVKSAPTLCPYHHLDTLHCTPAPTSDLWAVPEEQGLRTARGVLSSTFPSQEINDLQKHGLISSPTCFTAGTCDQIMQQARDWQVSSQNTHQRGKKNTRFLRGNIGQQ